MKRTEILSALKGIPGFEEKVTYRMWPEGKAPPLPFLCYFFEGSDNFPADGVVYYGATPVTIELYTAYKDPDSEALVEAALDAGGVFWEKTETYIESERCYQITYEIEV